MTLEKLYLRSDARAATGDLAKSCILEVGQTRTLRVALVKEQIPETEGPCLSLELFHDGWDGLVKCN